MMQSVRIRVFAWIVAGAVSCVMILFSLSIVDIAWHTTPSAPNFFSFATHYPGKYTNKFWYFYTLVIFQIVWLILICLEYLYSIYRRRQPKNLLIRLLVFEMICCWGTCMQAKNAILAASCQPPAMIDVIEHIFIFGTKAGNGPYQPNWETLPQIYNARMIQNQQLESERLNALSNILAATRPPPPVTIP